MARCPTLESTFALLLDVPIAIGETGIYSPSQMKDYKEAPETSSRSRANHYWFVVVTYSGLHVDQYGSPRRPILGCCSA